MTTPLESPEIDDIAVMVEEAARSTEEGVKRFVEPAAGTLRRATSKRHHIVFGRRGSGKSSLLHRAFADLRREQQPIAYVDLEVFKGHSHPDVLLGVLIKTFSEFDHWLRDVAIDAAAPAGSALPDSGGEQRPAFDKKAALPLSNTIRLQITGLQKMLYAADNGNAKREAPQQIAKSGQAVPTTQPGATATAPPGKTSDPLARAKIDYLHRHVLEYQQTFQNIARFSGGDTYLFLDDLYHIRRQDQARLIDYFHSIAKGNHLWLKIGTIRYRSTWYVYVDTAGFGNGPIGVKLGDDADEIDLDLTLEKYALTRRFLVTILRGFVDDGGLFSIQDIMTEKGLERLILASGGVARDFLNIFRRSIDVARNRIHQSGTARRGPKITQDDIDIAAGEHDAAKRNEFSLDTSEDQIALGREFRRLREFCIQNKTNVFLIDKDTSARNMAPIRELVDLRLLHKVRNRTTVSARPGAVFESYMLDISQYTGARAVHGMQIIEFWKDDARDQLRRASLIYTPGAQRVTT